MGFKNMKRDDHGHVISNDEVDGQKCKHVSGQADKVEDQKYNKEMKEAQEQNAAMSEAFDDNYDEEFADYESESSRAGHYLEDAEEYIGEENAAKIEYLMNEDGYKVGMFEDSIAKNLGKDMSPEDALMQSIQDVQDKLFDEEEFDEQSPEDEKEIGKDELENNWDKKFNQTKDSLNKIFSTSDFDGKPRLTDYNPDNNYMRFFLNGNYPQEVIKKKLKESGFKNPHIRYESDYGEWQIDTRHEFNENDFGLEDAIKISDDDILDEEFGKDTPERKLVGAIKGGSNPPTPPEGPDNPPIRDKDGKNLGSVNAFQIKKHSREQQNQQENEMKSRYQKIREVLGDNADETIEWLFNHLSRLNDYKKGE